MVHRALKVRVLVVVLVAIAVVAVLVLSAAPTSAKSCARSPDYGTQCETISGNGLTVVSIQAQFTTVANFLDQHTWTFETTTYQCDPRGRPKAECPPEQRAYGTPHPPNARNTAETVCTSEGPNVVGANCSGSLRFSVPRTFSGMRWICVEVAVQVNGKWVDNGAGLPHGDRACRQVH
jgi:hypothetical protein